MCRLSMGTCLPARRQRHTSAGSPSEKSSSAIGASPCDGRFSTLAPRSFARQAARMLHSEAIVAPIRAASSSSSKNDVLIPACWYPQQAELSDSHGYRVPHIASRWAILRAPRVASLRSAFTCATFSFATLAPKQIAKQNRAPRPGEIGAPSSNQAREHRCETLIRASPAARRTVRLSWRWSNPIWQSRPMKCNSSTCTFNSRRDVPI